ncbi:Alpha-D-kanosaminyltransferase [compost metagenome]
MLLDHCLATPGQHQVIFLDAPQALLERFAQAGVDCLGCAGAGQTLRHLRSRSSEAPVLNTHNVKGLLYGWLGATLLRLPLVITQHGFTPRSHKQRFYTWLSLQLCRTSSVKRVVCVAQSIATLHQQAKVGADKLQVIPNGLPATLPYTSRAHGKARWLVGYVGRLSREKGPDLFLDALIPLCLQHPQLQAVMLGDGPEREALQERIDACGLHERIALPGYQTDMQRWMKNLDVLVISSRTEGTPMILLEAMQAGLPVVAFAVGGIPDVIEHQYNGLLAQPGDSAELGLQVDVLLGSPALARALTENARATQLDRYHLPVLAERWSQLYLSTAAEARA